MIEKDFTIDSAGNRLSGTLCLAMEKVRFPFVLMTHGTGPLDRNENMPGQQLNGFKAIARHLAGKGIVSLRYDKRGCFCDADRIFVLGHRAGCIIAPQVALKRPSVAAHKGLVVNC